MTCGEQAMRAVGDSRNVRRRGRFLAIAAAIAAVALVASACSDTSDEGEDGKRLRVVFSSAPAAINVVGLKMTDIVREQGIDVEVSYLDGGAKAIQSVLAGQVDVASNAIDDTINSGLVAFALSRPRNMYALVGQPGLDSLDEVEGKTLGAADTGSVANVFGEAIFKKNGIDRDSVTWAQIGGTTERTSALLSGKVDMALVYGDHHISLLNEGFETVVTVADEFPGLHDDLWVASPDWLAENEDLAQALAEAQLEAAQWFHENPEEFIDYAVESVDGLDREVAEQFYELALSVDMYPLDGLLTRESLLQTYELFEEAEAVEPTDIEDWATTKYIDRAREELGISAPDGSGE